MTVWYRILQPKRKQKSTTKKVDNEITQSNIKKECCRLNDILWFIKIYLTVTKEVHGMGVILPHQAKSSPQAESNPQPDVFTDEHSQSI